MEYDLNDIVERKRSTSTDYHLLIARGWRRLGEPVLHHTPLAYSAFELRCAIERTLFEFLWLTQSQKLTEKDFNIANRVSTLVKETLKRQGGLTALERKLRFARAFAQGIGMPPTDWPAVVDLKKLEKMWNALSEYCHRQLEPKKTWEAMGDHWVRNGYALLKEVESYLRGGLPRQLQTRMDPTRLSTPRNGHRTRAVPRGQSRRPLAQDTNETHGASIGDAARTRFHSDRLMLKKEWAGLARSRAN